MNELALFAGAGGGILGGHLLGWRTVCAVEHDPYAIAVLSARQNDGVLPPFPVWDDIRTFDGRPWRGRVDVVSGGFPCTDISSAGKGAGIDGEHSGLWSEMARIVGEVRPRYVFVENSPLLVSRGLARVLGDLAQMGYDARWGIVGARHAGAPHRRDRIWIVAHVAGIGHGEGREPGDIREEDGGSDGGLYGIACGAGDVADADSLRREQNPKPGELRTEGVEQPPGDCWMAHSGEGHKVEIRGENGIPNGYGERLQGRIQEGIIDQEGRQGQVDGSVAERGFRRPRDRRGAGWWGAEPDLGLLADGLAAGIHGATSDIEGGVGRVATGVPNRVDRLRCIGNGQVPLAAAIAWELLAPGSGEKE